LPYGIKAGTKETKYYIAGEESFEIEEIEIYRIISKNS
jgi:hypothetical protein